MLKYTIIICHMFLKNQSQAFFGISFSFVFPILLLIRHTIVVHFLFVLFLDRFDFVLCFCVGFKYFQCHNILVFDLSFSIDITID